MADNDKVTKNTEMEIIPPHPANYVRSVTGILTKQLREQDDANLEVPTLLSRAKSLVNKKSYIILFTTKEG
jgi:hypothetical protein